MPSILLVNKNGNVVTGMGYSSDIVHRLKGAVEVMLGEKSEEQIEAELHPEMKETSTEVLAGNRHFNFGMVMRKRGQPERAIAEFQKALEANPLLSEARVELAGLYLGKGKVAEAEEQLVKGGQDVADTTQGKMCLARIKVKKGLADEAVRDLNEILHENSNNHTVRYYLGKAYEAQKRMTDAQAEYKQAYLLLADQVKNRQAAEASRNQ